jgi:tRNA pseudouridine13 synthase
MSLDLRFPYITERLPGVGGWLRLEPEHFVVEEIPLYAPQGEGQHLYVSLTKVGLTTKEVQTQLERLFGLSRGAVSFAGMKDKHARTTQTFSLNVGYQKSGFAETAAQQIGDALPVEVHWATFHRNKLKPGHLLGNRFAVTVSAMECDVDEAERRVAAIAAALSETGLPNFYGPQRFGSGGSTVRQGLEVLLGERSVRDRWLRRFVVAGYQSYLCNRYLAARVEEGLFGQLLCGDIAKKYATGGMFVVEDVAAEQLRYTQQEISFTAPMYGPKMWAATDEAGALEERILEASPVTLAQFADARVEGTRRLGRLLIRGMQWSCDPEQQTLTLAFDLPKGAYATTVLREFMKVDPAEMPELDTDVDE